MSAFYSNSLLERAPGSLAEINLSDVSFSLSEYSTRVVPFGSEKSISLGCVF